MTAELRRLIVRHRQVAPMVSALLAGTDAAVTIRAADGELILERQGSAGEASGRRDSFDILAGRERIGTVEGGRIARAIAAVLSYAASRERDARSLAQEALERYRELSLIYDLAGSIGASLDVTAIAVTAMAEAARLPNASTSFLLLLSPGERLEPVPGITGDAEDDASRSWATRLDEGVVGSVAAAGSAELVDDIAADPRASAAERSTGGAVVVAPLRAIERTVGVLGAATAPGTAFRAADLKVISAIAALAGPALEQARRHAATLDGTSAAVAGGPAPASAGATQGAESGGS
jgi:hypothetical protein